METPSLSQKLAHYTPSEEVKSLLAKTPTILIVGISGAGKDTIMGKLLARYPQEYHYIVSHTTRAPRANDGVMEQEGKEYHFIDLTTAEKMVDARQFIEANIYSGNLYGTSVTEFERAAGEGKIAITDLEVQGVADYVKLASTVRPVFILPPNYATWRQRFIARYGEHVSDYEEDLQKRIATAEKEVAFVLSVDYFSFVINADLEDAVEATHRVLLEGNRKEGRRVAEELLQELRAHQA
jgi:guanylate kinase